MSYSASRIFLFRPSVEHQDLGLVEEQFFAEWLPEHGITDDRLLYHYTDLDGLRGILSERSLRMSHSSTLNDPAELEYGKLLAIEVIEKLQVDSELQDVREFLRALIGQVRSIGNTIHDLFVTSFCEDGDLLSQWRGYTHLGSGYNLGFRFSEHTRYSSVKPLLERCQPPELRKVIYDRARQSELLEKYLLGVVGAVRAATKRGGDVLRARLGCMQMAVQSTLTELVLCFKSSSFSEEKEWRFFRLVMDSHEPETIGFNFTQNTIRPYRSVWLFDLVNGTVGNFPLQRLTSGPAHEAMQGRQSLRLFLQAIARKDAEVPLSQFSDVQSSAFRFRGNA